jgi:competence protein ComEA
MLGFTRQEQVVILFLVTTLLVGSAGRVYQSFFQANMPAQIDSVYTAAFSRQVEDNRRADKSTEKAVVETDGLSNTGSHSVRINLNTATAAELQSIPHIGPVLAGKIIDFRTQSGGITDLNELISVNGIGKTTLNRIRPYLVLE